MMRAPLSVDETPRDTRKRRLRLFTLVGVILMVLWIVYVSANVLFPSQGEAQSRSDAVVSLAPQHHRLYTATQLAAAGHADTLMISHFDDEVAVSDAGQPFKQVSVSDYCAAHEGNGVMCFMPEEVATIGEAFTVRDISAQESWEAVTVVTSRTHAFRAHYIFDQCVGDDVHVNLIHADPDLNVFQWVWHLAYENAAFIKALWQTATRC